MAVTGLPDGEPGASPLRVGIPVVDSFAGMNAAIAVMAALESRAKTGQGRQIDISLFESAVASLHNAASSWLNAGVNLGRTGNDHPSAAPYGVFEASDGYIIVATFNGRGFERLANVLGHPEWLEDERFRCNSERVRNAPRSRRRSPPSSRKSGAPNGSKFSTTPPSRPGRSTKWRIWKRPSTHWRATFSSISSRRVALRGRYLGVQANIAELADVDNLVERAIEAFGAVHGLVNNAGISGPGIMERLTIEQWWQVIDVHLTGAFLCSQAVGKHMIERAKAGDDRKHLFRRRRAGYDRPGELRHGQGRHA